MLKTYQNVFNAYSNVKSQLYYRVGLNLLSSYSPAFKRVRSLLKVFKLINKVQAIKKTLMWGKQPL